MNLSDYLGEVVIVLLVGVVIALVLGRARVASIAGLVLAGVLIGPYGLALVGEIGHVEVLADIGVALLLFGIGLELTPAKLRRLKREVFVAGSLQVLGTTGAVAAAAAWLLGLSTGPAIFLGCVAALSSTGVVLTRLDQRQELGRPHGRLALGVLVMQDVAVVPMVLLVPVLAGADMSPGDAFVQVASKTAFVVLTVVLGRYVARGALDLVARSRQRELFVVTMMALCLGTAWLAALAGVSLAIGAFLGGVVVASTQYRYQSLAQVVPLRDVFTSFFFVSIGMALDTREILARPADVFGLTLGLMALKLLVTTGVALIGRWPIRTAVASALCLTQIGEFSVVLIHAAGGTGLLTPDLEQSLYTAIALSLLLTPVLIDSSQNVAGWIVRVALRRRSAAAADDAGDAVTAAHVVIAGYGRAGRLVHERLTQRGIPVCIVDVNPDNIADAKAAGSRALYGDCADPVLLRHAGVAEALAVIVAINDVAATERTVRSVREVGPSTRILARATYSSTVERLRLAGADEVVDLEEMGAVDLADRVGTIPGHEPASTPLEGAG